MGRTAWSRATGLGAWSPFESPGQGRTACQAKPCQGTPRHGDKVMLIEMSIKGLMVDPMAGTPIVILKDKQGDRVLPIWVGVPEANAIALQIENVSTPRPMTHDLLRNIITDLEGRVDRVVVSELRDNTYFAIIHLTVRGERVAVDARPSDAIALALRTRSPILVEEAVIEHARTADFSSEPADNERLQKWLESLDPEELGKYKM
jgi:bifunctional DNase/RNase